MYAIRSYYAVHDLRQSKIVDGDDLDGNETENGGYPLHLEKDIDTETGVLVEAVDEVELFTLHKLRETGAQQLLGEGDRILFGEDLRNNFV